ncbi:hypothetical protein Bbelb_047900 [Branchiostoma belcheri]|nr:hypothetical protein Bbelb_047900 [Branchiostoma belcheri]
METIAGASRESVSDPGQTPEHTDTPTLISTIPSLIFTMSTWLTLHQHLHVTDAVWDVLPIRDYTVNWNLRRGRILKNNNTIPHKFSQRLASPIANGNRKVDTETLRGKVRELMNKKHDKGAESRLWKTTEAVFLSIYEGRHHHWAKISRAVVHIKGLDLLRLRKALEAEPQLLAELLCMSTKKTTATNIIDMMVCKFSAEGSSRKNVQKDVFDKLCSWMDDVESVLNNLKRRLDDDRGPPPAYRPKNCN